jgi:hypothetical protein
VSVKNDKNLKANKFGSRVTAPFCGVIAHIEPRPPRLEVSRSPTIRHSLGGTPLSGQMVARPTQHATNTRDDRPSMPSGVFESSIPEI